VRRQNAASDWLALPQPSSRPATRAEGLLQTLDNVTLRLDRWLDRGLPPELNPLSQLGAVANLCLLVAILSGILLLIWYTPSVHQAYASLETVRTSSWLGQLVRSLHRYSSDGCLLFIVLHALRSLTQRRFTGPRWLAWTTGVAMFALLGFIGWTGYWLVWDVRAQHVALGTARFIDRLPLFAEPLARSFLTDQSVHSLLFFLIFFVHMLAPLSVGVGIWMHLMRVNRALFLTSRALTLWVISSLILVSALMPALSAGPAQMTIKTPRFSIDWWYLWPITLTDRLSGGLLWAFFLITGLIALTLPWWMAKRRLTPAWKAEVNLPRCMGCTLCSKDCPFNAITMVPREDGRKFVVQSYVNLDLCVGCGICVGSCDSQAINLPAFNSRDLEQRLYAWIDQRTARGEKSFVAFCCADSAGADLGNETGERLLLPGYRIERVPCVGWISAVMLERILQRGAAGILVVGCGEGDPVGREGMKWFGDRMTGRREPWFDPVKADPARVRFIALDRTQPEDLRATAREFQLQTDFLSATNKTSSTAPIPDLKSLRVNPPAPSAEFWPRFRPLSVRLSIALTVLLLLAAITVLVSQLPYRSPHSPEPELVVSFNHSGAILEPRKLTKEELEERLPHMRAQINVTRERSPVRLRIQVDGSTVLDQSYRPKGLANDGPSIAIARLSMKPGRHEVAVDLADSANADDWTQHWRDTVEFSDGRIRVVLFDGKNGFSLY
jgi:ferredoxin/coenzyme F420-reducing hydrogenase delta subunit